MPPFHGERVYTCGETMREITDRVVESWPVGHPFLLHPEIEKITLNIILQTIFGIDKEPDLRRLYDRLLRILTLGASPLALIPRLQALLGPFTGQQRLRRLVQEVDEILFTQIARNRAVGSAGYTDVLFLLINARDESGRPMSEIELRDTLMTLVVAGHDTTATSLAWIFLYILQYPDVLEKIREELYRVVGSGPVLPQQIDQLAYLDATVKEVQRVIPIFPLASRRLHTPMCIGGWDLPAGVVAGSCIYLTHRRPDIWPNPEQFDPDRFLGKKANPYEFFPFGGGAHYCIGAAFALYEMKVVLAEVLSRVALHVASGYTVRVVRRSLTLAPSAGVPVVVDARRSPLSAREI
jgi:cytochrome P450